MELLLTGMGLRILTLELSSLYTSISKHVVPAWTTGIQATGASKITIPGTGYPLPGGYDGLLEHLCITTRATAWEPANPS